MDLHALDNERQRLETLSRYDILDTPREPAFDDLTEIATRFCHAPISLISFLDRDREWFKSKLGTELREVSRDHDFASRAMRTGGILIVPDVTSDDALKENPLVKDEPHVRFFAGCPLINADGQPLGALYILDHEPHELSSDQQQMLRLLSHEAMMLLELRRETRELRHRHEKAVEEMKAQFEAQTAEHRRVEERLKRREQQLEDAQRMTHLGSWEWDLQANAISWSDELYRIYGLQPGEFEATYAAYLNYVHPEDRGKVSRAVERALLSKGSFEAEERIIRADGAIRVLSSRGEVILDVHGEPVRMVGCCHDITNRKEVEEKLHHSHSLLHATLEATADGILVVDLQGKIVQFNHKFAELWHIPIEIVNLYDDRRLLEVVLEQLVDPPGFLAQVENLYQNQESASFDVLEFRDGRTFERFSCPQRLNQEIVGRVWSFRDVTERCRVLRILRHSEERYRSLVVATAQIVWITDPDGQLVDDSQSWRQFTGQSFGEMKNQGWTNAIHPRDRRRVIETWKHALATGTAHKAEFRLQSADGHWHHMSARSAPVREPGGGVREWIGFCIDITERKNREQVIVDERNLSQAIINSLPGIFYFFDETGLNLRWNDNLQRVSEYSSQEIARMRAIDFVVQEEKSLIAERVQEVFATGEGEVQVNLLTKTGKRLPFYCTGKLVHIDGHPRLIGMGIDISALQQAEAEIMRLNTELERRVVNRTSELAAANKELQTFTYTVSHDLRAPIRAILGFAQAIEDDAFEALNPDCQEYLRRIVRAGNRMMQLIDDLLDYCQVGRQPLQLRSIALNDLLAPLEQEFAPRIRALKGRISIAADLPEVLGDPPLLQQIFSNLFDNALNYRKPDVSPQVTVTYRASLTHVIICVTDNGIGIAPPHHQRIFELFQCLDANRDYTGTGIGLATAKKAVEKLGGEIWVESELGQGSSFCIKLQRALSESTPKGAHIDLAPVIEE